eukprot:m.277380 g.277380  ORF g.277380 m.277380 type:complete len:89 (+) comp15726_c1_seq2:56-322(+)
MLMLCDSLELCWSGCDQPCAKMKDLMTHITPNKSLAQTNNWLGLLKQPETTVRSGKRRQHSRAVSPFETEDVGATAYTCHLTHIDTHS